MICKKMIGLEPAAFDGKLFGREHGKSFQNSDVAAFHAGS